MRLLLIALNTQVKVIEIISGNLDLVESPSCDRIQLDIIFANEGEGNTYRKRT